MDDLARRARRVAAELRRPVMSQGDVRHHAGQAREWAEAADREGAEARHKVARTFAEVSQAHALAALATRAEGGAEPLDRIAATIDRCKKIEADAAPRAREGLPNEIALAQGEIQAAEYLRELLEEPLPEPECP